MSYCFVLVALLTVSTAQADIIFVDVNCPGPGNGSVRDPYCSIQTAIDNAVDTDEIVVAPGTYFETINFLGKAVWLLSSGGAEVTTIDANLPRGEFASVVTCDSGEGPDTVLDGFTITGGTGKDVFGAGITRGGGMYNFLSSPTVVNCDFIRNSATESGGGMWNNSSSPTVNNCTFDGNSAVHPLGVGFGGGISNRVSNPRVTNCTFFMNSACIFGGAMSNSDSCPIVTNCRFTANTAGESGGGIYSHGSSPTVTNCTFDGNSAVHPLGVGSGGGMANQSSSSTVTNCTFSENMAVSGGGMGSTDSSPTVTNCTFTGNTATHQGGGMRNSNSSDPTVTNCTFSGNSANTGGGMFNSASSSTVTVTNCILWGDSPDEIVVSGDDPNVTFSNVEGGFPGTGNIDADPLFVDPDNGDLRLQAGSPCIDAGDNTAVPRGVLRDLDGNPRFIDSTFVGTMATVDMGAYEYQRSVGGGRAIADGSWLRDVLTLLGWIALPDFD